MAVGFVASATSGSRASVSSFDISASLGTGARCGIVFVATHNNSSDLITGVTWNGSTMTRLYRAVDTDTEPGSVVAYFLDNVTNGAVTVSRTSSTVVTVGYAASISAASACAAYQTITRANSTQNTDADSTATGTGASGAVAVDDGSPGTDSMRFACAYTGAATPVAANTANSTSLQLLDSTAFGSRFVRETTAGQGSRSVGFATGTTDDWALVAVAVRETPVASTNAPAEVASGTGSAPASLDAIGVMPGAATGTGTAHDATATGGAFAPAGLAEGTASTPTVSTRTQAAAPVSSGTGSAPQATPNVSVMVGP